MCVEQDLSAVQAMSSVLCCGPVFDTNGLNDDGYVYSWLDTLLSSDDEKVERAVPCRVLCACDVCPVFVNFLGGTDHTYFCNIWGLLSFDYLC